MSELPKARYWKLGVVELMVTDLDRSAAFSSPTC